MSGVKRSVYAARVALARKLAAQGMTRREIAAGLGLSFDGACHLCRRNRIFTKRIRSVNSHPLVKQLIDIANEQQADIDTIAERVGMNRTTMHRWRYSTLPRIDLLIAAANTLGYELVLRERRD